MDLSQDVMDGLQLLANKQRISENVFNELCKQIRKALTEGEQLHLSSAEEKLSAIALMTLLVECTKTNSTENVLRNVIKDVNITQTDEDAIVKLWHGIKDSLRCSLERMSIDGVGNASIVDCSWKQYNIKSSNREDINEINYLCNIKTNPEEKSLVFQASLIELQDFVSKLREATKVVQKTFSK